MNAFFRGIASVFDFWGSIRNPEVERIIEQTDAEALASDWNAIGGDMNRAVESNLESVPMNPLTLERVREILKRRGFKQYQ